MFRYCELNVYITRQWEGNVAQTCCTAASSL